MFLLLLTEQNHWGGPFKFPLHFLCYPVIILHTTREVFASEFPSRHFLPQSSVLLHSFANLADLIASVDINVSVVESSIPSLLTPEQFKIF